MKRSEILVEAKKFLWDGHGLPYRHKSEYICHALERAYHAHLKGMVSWNSVVEIRGMIMDHIHPHHTVGDMVAAASHQPYGETEPTVIQAKRLEIMDLFIARLREEEATIPPIEL